MNDEKKLPSHRTVNRTRERGFAMLVMLGVSETIRNNMQVLGYSDEDHQQGWELLRNFCQLRRPDLGKYIMESKRAYMDELKKLVADTIARAFAGLGHHFPEQERFIRSRLPEQEGANAVLLTESFMESVKVLDEGTAPEREALRDEDRLAVTLLRERRILDERAELRLTLLLNEVKAPDMGDGPGEEAAYLELYRTRFEAFQAWVKDWSRTALIGLSDRRHLISMGLVTRKLKREQGGGEALKCSACPYAASDAAGAGAPDNPPAANGPAASGNSSPAANGPAASGNSSPAANGPTAGGNSSPAANGDGDMTDSQPVG